MYNADLVRKLCSEIATERDPEKTNDLLLLLRAVMREDVEEIRVRMAFFAKKYPTVNTQAPAEPKRTGTVN